MRITSVKSLDQYTIKGHFVVVDLSKSFEFFGATLSPAHWLHLFGDNLSKQGWELVQHAVLSYISGQGVYPTFIKFIADAYHSGINIVFVDALEDSQFSWDPDSQEGSLEYTSMGRILISIANEFLNSKEVNFSELEIRNNE